MKKIVLVFCLVLFFSISFQVNAQWYEQNSGDDPYYSIFFINELVGFSVGHESLTPNQIGVILKTINGGDTWVQQSTEIDLNMLEEIVFYDNSNGIMVGWHGSVYWTTDSGITWIDRSLQIDTNLYSVAHLSENSALACGSMGTIVKTTDAGENWTFQQTDVNEPLFDIQFYNSDIGFCAGGAGVFLKTTDGGENWVRQLTNSTFGIFGLSILDLDTVIGVGEQGMIFRTTNGGTDWNSVRYGNYYDLYDVSFGNKLTGYSVGKSAFKIKTTDCGITWQTLSSDSSLSSPVLLSVHFIDSINGWASGWRTILHTTNGGVTFIEDEENNFTQPKEFLLQQNYPNPFNPSTSIQYAISSTQFVTLKVYDLLGREVATLVNEEKPAGSYNVEFRMQNLPTGQAGLELSSGIYFYKLQAGDFVETKKMILLK